MVNNKDIIMGSVPSSYMTIKGPYGPVEGVASRSVGAYFSGDVGGWLRIEVL